MEQRNQDIDRRSRLIHQGKRGDGPVVYWMSREQRLDDNWALLAAQQEAILRHKPLVVAFCLIPDFPGANLRHYLFLLKGLRELRARLLEKNIGFALLRGAPPDELPPFLARCDAHMVIGDFDPLRIKRQWQKRICAHISIPFGEVDGHNIIPAWLVSEKKEYGAYTLRPKVKRLLPEYLCDFPELVRHPFHGEKESDGPQYRDPVEVYELAATISDRSLGEVAGWTPGENAALQAMGEAISHRLPGYDSERNDPNKEGQSDLSPYLHFGQLAPQRLALAVQAAELAEADRDAFLEELIVRRELSDNFCLYEPNYDNVAGFHDWAKTTLNAHRADKRDYCYSREQFDQGETHEALWNACQRDLVHSGKLHGYLRMYWAKKILEWSPSPEEAQATAISLNDRYSLDGRDPNGYTGIAWSIGGIHDRAWSERPVYGKVRYMNEKGCRRKFDVPGYIRQVEEKVRAPRLF